MSASQSDLMNIKDIVIGIAAFSGMGMSFYNLWREKQKEKVKLKVIPKSVISHGFSSTGKEVLVNTKNAFKGESSGNRFAIEIINLSKFDVTIDELGFTFVGSKERYIISGPIFGDQGEWPRKLEPRESFTAYCLLSELMNKPKGFKISSAYSGTSCDEFIEGTSDALKGLVEFMTART